MRALTRLRESEPALAWCVLIATALCALSFLAQGHLGINMQDEAFLWYGVVRTHAGELPLRDFRSYDPGRYLWCAAWSTLFGDGLVAVRAAGTIFVALGVCAGLLVVSRATASRFLLVLAGIVLVVWVATPWKPYEPSTALIGTWLATRTLEKPAPGRWFACGAFIGLAAFFGRNLGLYAAAGMVAAAAYMTWKTREPAGRALTRLALGTVVGYAPMLLLIAFDSGFRAAFVDSITFWTRQRSLNVSVPVIWPWLVDPAGRPFLEVARDVAIGLVFVLGPIGYLAGAVRAVLSRTAEVPRLAPIVAATFIGVPWFHHASVASEVSHLSQVIHPWLVGALCAPLAFPETRARLVRIVAWVTVGLLTFFAVGTSMPIVIRLTAPPGREHVTVRVGNDDLIVPPLMASTVNGLRRFVKSQVPPDEPIFVTAQNLIVQPLLGRRSPVWDIFPFWEADAAEQDRMLRELADVRWALVDTRPVGTDPHMRLGLSHPRVWSMLQAEFDRVPVSGAGEWVYFLRRKDP